VRAINSTQLNPTSQVCSYLLGNALRLRHEPSRLMLSIGLSHNPVHYPSFWFLFKTQRFGVPSFQTEHTLLGPIDKSTPCLQRRCLLNRERTWILSRTDSELIVLSPPEFWSSRKTRDESILQGQCLTRLSHEAELTHLFIVGYWPEHHDFYFVAV
jgi:hypothetical protein